MVNHLSVLISFYDIHIICTTYGLIRVRHNILQNGYIRNY